MKLTLKCDECGTAVIRYPSTAKAKRVFCSKGCLGASKKHGSELACVNCGKKFYRRFGEQGDSRNQYCSKPCYFEHRDHGKSYKRVGDRHLHRIVAEQKLGRPLRPGEIAHHEDRNKRNNAPDNITVLENQSEHAKLHFTKTRA